MKLVGALFIKFLEGPEIPPLICINLFDRQTPLLGSENAAAMKKGRVTRPFVSST